MFESGDTIGGKVGITYDSAGADSQNGTGVTGHLARCVEVQKRGLRQEDEDPYRRLKPPSTRKTEPVM